MIVQMQGGLENNMPAAECGKNHKNEKSRKVDNEEEEIHLYTLTQTRLCSSQSFL